MTSEASAAASVDGSWRVAASANASASGANAFSAPRRGERAFETQNGDRDGSPAAPRSRRPSSASLPAAAGDQAPPLPPTTPTQGRVRARQAMGTPSQSGPPPTTRKFSFSSSLRAGSGNAALQRERAKWNVWVGAARERHIEPATLVREVIDARLTFPSSVISRRDCGELVRRVVDLEDTATGGGASARLVSYFSQRKHIEFNVDALAVVVPSLLREVRASLVSPDQCLDALQALSYVLFSDGARCSAFEEEIVRTLVDDVLRADNADLACAGAAFGCLGNLLQRKALLDAQAPEVAQLALRSISLLLEEAWDTPATVAVGQPPSAIENTGDSRLQKLKVLQAALRVVHGCLLAFGADSLQTKLHWFAGALTRVVCETMQVCKTEKRLRQGEASASESEMSDSDMERKSSSSRVLKQLEKIRLAALDLLDALCKFDRKLMQTQWERLLPQRNGSVLNLKAPHLLTVLLFDAQPRVRCATFRVVSALFANSPVRVWLSQPRPAGKASAFVPMSVKISHIVEEVFYALGRVLGGQESNPTALEQAHQCAVTVLRAVPFEVRGNEGFFLTPFLQGCAGPLTARLADAKVPEKVRLAAAATCAALVSAPKGRLESVAAFTTTHLIPALEQVDLAANEWSMPLVGAMCEQYAREVSRGTLWDATHRVLLQCFASRLPSSRRAAVGLVERILRRDKVSEPPITSALAGWNEVLSVHLPRALRDPDPDVRSCAAVCVSEIRTEGWALVSDAQRRECVSGILSAYGGKEETQRATLTALGAMALVPEFRTPVFMRDGVPLLLVALEASNLQVRARGALALANIVYEPDRASHLDQLIAPDTRCALTEACITHVPDHDKVAAPCLRALGALYAGFATSLFNNENSNGSQEGSLGARVAHALLEGANGKGEASAKVRWSACASIGLVLSRGTDSTRQRDFVEVLADQAAQNENFKVRIAAVTALHEGIRALHARSDLRAVVRETLGPALLSLVNARGMVDVSQARFAAKLDDALRALLRGVADSEWPEQGGDLASLIGSQEMLGKE